MDLKVKFKDLKIGEEFECFGDIFINYDYPKICKCIKETDDGKKFGSAKEIDGISFWLNREDEVFKNINV